MTDPLTLGDLRRMLNVRFNQDNSVDRLPVRIIIPCDHENEGGISFPPDAMGELVADDKHYFAINIGTMHAVTVACKDYLLNLRAREFTQHKPLPTTQEQFGEQAALAAQELAGRIQADLTEKFDNPGMHGAVCSFLCSYFMANSIRVLSFIGKDIDFIREALTSSIDRAFDLAKDFTVPQKKETH